MTDVAHLLSQSSLSAYEELCAVTLLSQAHTLLLRDVLKVSPDAVIGLSLGETNALYAFGLWKDSSGLLDDSAIVNMYEQQLGGSFDVHAMRGISMVRLIGKTGVSILR